MLDYSSVELERGLITLCNDVLDNDVYLYEDEYFKVQFNLWESDKIRNIIKTFKYKNVGNSYDYPEVIPENKTFIDSDIYNEYDKTNVICVSEKFNSIMMYSAQKYCTVILLLIDKKYYKKFNKKISNILDVGRSSGIFNNVDFKCKKKEYIEISNPINEADKYISIQKKKIPKENLVFDTSSEIFKVMQDISLFFKPETKELYNKMNILYKRGIILYGEPGNGKSAMIREIIRQTENVSVIIINPNIPRLTFVLSELINALNKKPSIIVIEDIDAVINNVNRSEFLNILDGVDIQSGCYFIGTTNYPERIDPAFVNRSGRFDRMYQIPNPNENVRKAFFRSCNIAEILKDFIIHKNNSENHDLSIIELFVKYSENLSMANLKELMISTQYMLISDKNMSIEQALETNYNMLISDKKKHDTEFDDYEDSKYIPSKRRKFEIGKF